MRQETIEQTLLERLPWIIGLLFGLMFAAVCGYFVAQGLLWAIFVMAAIVALAWVFLFFNNPVNGVIAIVILKTFTDRVNIHLVGPVTVNSFFYLAVLV